MKRIKENGKKLLVLILVLATCLYNIPIVKAAGSVTVGFSGNSTANQNDTVTITIKATSITGAPDSKIFGFSGRFSYDATLVTLDKCTSSSALSYTKGGNGMFSFVDMSYEDGLSAGETIGTCKFKVVAATGTAVIGATEAQATDANMGSVNVTINSHTLTIGTATQPTQPTQPSQPSSEPTSGGGNTPKSNDANLSALSVEGYDLSPAFDPATTAYTIEVPEGATELKINATKSNSKATVAGDGTITISGDTATVTVTAEDGTKKSYTITIKKKTPVSSLDSNNKLKSLDISGYSINPKFDPEKTTYTMNVANSVTGLTVKATADSDKAKVTVLGNTGWKEGVNVVTVRVTAEDGSQRDYVINVTRAGSGNTTAPAKSNDNNIADLIIKSAHTMEPGTFNKDVTTYNLTVPYDVDKLDLTPTLSNANAKYEVRGNENFKVGEVNVVQIVVTAEDGSQKVYILNVTRSTDIDKTDIKEITIGGGYTLDPEFNPKKLTYTVNVKPGTKELDINAVAVDPESKVEIVGNKNLKTGDNTVLVKVTDKNGYVKYYTLNVVRPERKILGLTPIQFGIIAGIILLLLLLILFLLLKRRKKDDEEEKNVDIKVDTKKEAPVIEFKPEFNFNSRNGTDDDVVLSGGTLTQGSTTQKDVSYIPSEEKKVLDYKDADYEEVPYDPYDDVVTKDELIDAINEGLESHNPEKLKMLLEQEELNRKKEELRKKEEAEKARRDRY